MPGGTIHDGSLLCHSQGASRFFICGNIPSDGLTDRQICKSFFLKDPLDEAIPRAVKNKKKPA
jgi:hypothetical protein